MAVEIVHYRDPDSSCEVAVFVDGVRVQDVTYVSIDPGAGYSRSDWDEGKTQDMLVLSANAAIQAALYYEDADESKYIDEDGK